MSRPKEEIVASILMAAYEPVNRTRLMYRARLSYRQIIVYLEMLERKQLIFRTERGQWITTDIGRVYVNQYERINRLLGLEPIMVSHSV
jgi:predicted transcriptional regulator